MCGGKLGISNTYLVVGDYKGARELLEESNIPEGCQVFYCVPQQDLREGVIRLKGLESFVQHTISQIKDKLEDTGVYRLIKN